MWRLRGDAPKAQWPPGPAALSWLPRPAYYTPLLRHDTEPGESEKQVKTQWLAWATKPIKGTTRGVGGGSLVHARLLSCILGGGGDGPGTERLWPLGDSGFLGSHLLDLLPPLQILILQDLVPGHQSRVADPLHLRTTTDTGPEPCTCPPVGGACNLTPRLCKLLCLVVLRPVVLNKRGSAATNQGKSAYIFHAYMPNSILPGAVGASITNQKFTFPSF